MAPGAGAAADKRKADARERQLAEEKAAKKAANLTKKKSGKGDEDMKFLDGQSQRKWTDSFVVLCGVRWIAGQAMGLRSSQEVGISAEKKKKEVEKVEFKEAAWEFVNNFKIPVGLITLLVLTCALIAGGESFDSYARENKKEAVDDFYGTLGVERDAEDGDVKRAYKTLAKRWHPDKNPNCTSCAETFNKIAEAYETLSVAEKRASYDETGGVATAELKSARSVPLTRDNFDELVTYSNDVWLVQVFKPEDGSCAQFHPFWESQIQKHGHLVRFGRIDITSDMGKWLPIKIRALPTVLKYGRHLGAPEIFPITATHDTPRMLMNFVLTSFPNIGLPLHKDGTALNHWLSGSSRKHKVLFSIPGKSEEERYKSHLVVRKLAATWSEIFEFRIAETGMLHKLPDSDVPPGVKAALPPADQAGQKGGILFFPAQGGATAPTKSALVSWPTEKEDELVQQLLTFAEFVGPALSAQSAELLCKSLATRRVYCLVLLDPSREAVGKAVGELRESKVGYEKEMQEIREGGGEVPEGEDDFVVSTVRLHREKSGLQPSIATCTAPKFQQVQEAMGDTGAFLMDLDTGRLASLKGTTSFRGLYPKIAYEETLQWVDDTLHPHLSLPDCNEGFKTHIFRAIRTSPLWLLAAQMLALLFLVEATMKAMVEWSWRWLLGATVLLLLMLVQSPVVVRFVASYVPGALLAPTLVTP